MVTQACENPTYSGGRDQKDHNSNLPAQGNGSRDPISKGEKKPCHTEGLVEWLKVSTLSSNSSTKQTKTPEYKKKRAVEFGSKDTANCARTK
jgi:hypothetical protein